MQNGEPHDMHAPAVGVHGDGATYRITLATAGALGSWQTPVSLLSGLTGGSDQTDQTWVTLQQQRHVSFSATTMKMSLFEPDYHSWRVLKDEMIRDFGGRKAARGFDSAAAQLTSVLTHSQPINN